jgi:hypothetical protein
MAADRWDRARGGDSERECLDVGRKGRDVCFSDDIVGTFCDERATVDGFIDGAEVFCRR